MVIRVVKRWVQDQISDFSSHIRCQSGNDVVETCPLLDDTAARELGLYLGEPNCRVGGPEGRDLDRHCRNGAGGGVLWRGLLHRFFSHRLATVKDGEVSFETRVAEDKTIPAA